MSKYEKGRIIKGTISGIESYGAFVTLDEFYTGLIHISEISDKYIKNPRDIVSVGDIVKVKILNVDLEKQKVALSMKGIN